MECHASLRDLPNLARTGPHPRQDRHGLQQFKAPRVEIDQPPNQEIKRPRSFRPAFHRSPIQSRLGLRKKILWPPCLDRALRYGAVDRRAMLNLLPGSVPAPIPVDSPSPKSGYPPLSSESAPPAKPRVLKVDIFIEASSYSNGSVSMTGSPRYAENAVLPPAEYDRLAPTRVPRAEWFPGYRDRVPWSHPHVHPWSALRLSLTSVAELDVDTLFKHLARPAGYIFPAPTAPRSNAAPPKSEWIPRLVTSAQVSALYQQEPRNHYPSQVTPVSFHETGWLAELASAYRDFETRHRQAL